MFPPNRRIDSIISFSVILSSALVASSKIKISGFVLSNNAIYLSLNNGKILEANISDGKQSSIFNVGGNQLSKPFINNKQLFIIKNNEIVKIY